MIKHKLHLDSTPSNKCITSIIVFREEAYLDLNLNMFNLPPHTFQR